MSPAEKLNLTSAKTSSDMTLVVIAIGVIVLGVVIWAVFIRRSPEELSGWGPSRRSYSPPSGATGEGSGSRKRRKWRRRRREHRPRNPTLAETGGLPPARSEDAWDAKD